MKKFVVALIAGVALVYLIGALRLGEFGAMSFVGNWETLSNDGKAAEVCALMHEDLAVELLDHSGEHDVEFSGGKPEFCEQTRTTIAGLQLLPHSMHVQQNDVQARRSWLHPWTSEVSYTEHRSITIHGANVTLNTVSEDTLTLVHTFSGVKLLKV